MFDMSSDIPNIVAKQGTVEDWIIENRSRELHAFHIHQLHFLLLEYAGREVNEDFLARYGERAFYDGRSLAYPIIRVRMDFRDPNVVGNICLSLPSARTRGQGDDGIDTRGSRITKRAGEITRKRNATPRRRVRNSAPGKISRQELLMRISRKISWCRFQHLKYYSHACSLYKDATLI